MRLYLNSASPFARKPLVILHEAAALDEVCLLHVKGTAIAPGDLPVAINPLGKIPVLEFDDGTALFDSRVICEYLCNRFANRLCPNDRSQWEAKRLEALADGIMDAALLVVYERRLRPAESQSQDWIAGQMSKIDRALDTLQPMAEDLGSFLHDTRTVGHFATAIALAYLDFRLTDYNWRAFRPHLSAWETDFSRRPSLALTKPKEPT